MNVQETLLVLDKLAVDNELSRPYVVGGMVRDHHLPGMHQIRDVDITTGDKDAGKLAKLFAKQTGKELQGKEEDEHYFVIVDGIKYDFSKDFKYPNIDKLLAARQVKKATDLQKETFSRDFTINTLLRTLDFREELDLTGRGWADIQNKILECPVDCDVSFVHDPKRILRAFYFKAKFNMKFSDNVRASINKNVKLLESISDRYASEMVNKTVKADPNIMAELIEMKVLQYIPLTKYITDTLLEQKKLLEVL